MTKPTITRERVLAWLRYDADMGLFFNHDDVMQRVNRGGYSYTRVSQRYFPTAHLVWLVETGEYPQHRVYFVDRNPLNTKFANLRCTPPINDFVADITPELILQHFEYDREFGLLKREGKIAGTVSNGYRMVAFAGRQCYHRQLIWTIETGTWPERRIVSSSRDRLDCRFSLLRMAEPNKRVTAEMIEAHERGEITLPTTVISYATRREDYYLVRRGLPEIKGKTPEQVMAEFDAIEMAKLLA